MTGLTPRVSSASLPDDVVRQVFPFKPPAQGAQPTIHSRQKLTAQSERRLRDLKEAYESQHEKYIATTPRVVEGAMKTWMDASIKDLPLGSHILEVGSASGRDAEYFESQGYEVLCSDVVLAFVDRLKQRGHRAIVLDAVSDTMPIGFDLIFANAVACHFEKDQFKTFLLNCRQSLNPGGKLSLSLKYGDKYLSSNLEYRMDAERRFTRWPQDALTIFLRDNGFSVTYSEVSGAIRSTSQWLNVVATNMRPTGLF